MTICTPSTLRMLITSCQKIEDIELVFDFNVNIYIIVGPRAGKYARRLGAGAERWTIILA